MTSIALAVDMHGGDFGLAYTLDAVLASVTTLPDDVRFFLCGNRAEILQKLTEKRLVSFVESGRFSIVDSHPLIGNGKANRLFRDEPESSLVRSVTLQSEGLVDVTLSAGDTAGLYMTSILVLGKDESIERPALAATFPSSGGGVVLILDVGANLECRASHLADFGYIGSNFMKRLTGREDITVGLLNVGHEDHKGPDVIKEAAGILKKCGLNYNGYIEGNRALTGDSDVVVCNGFTGNALLKVSEGMFRFVKSELGSLLNDQGKATLSRFDSELHGAVPILGVEGAVFKAHGNSSVNALTNAITTAVKTVYLMKKNG